MAIVIANENGDWWTFDPEDNLYILNTDDLPENEKDNWENYEEMDDSLIWEFGKPVPQGKLLKE